MNGLETEGTKRVVPGPERHRAGKYLETELLVRRIGPLPGAFFGVGMLGGAVFGIWAGGVAAIVCGTTALCGALVWWWLDRRRRRDLEKGHTAERQVGRALEQAVTAKACAVAHNVTGVLDSGDIDHIVATPRSVRVVETKYRRIPPHRFPQVLSRLRASCAEVAELLPPGTPVEAWLVLAYEEDDVNPNANGVSVCNHSGFRRQLLHQLKGERGDPVEIHRDVAEVVWRLGRGEAVEPYERSADPGRCPGKDVIPNERGDVRFGRTRRQWLVHASPLWGCTTNPW